MVIKLMLKKEVENNLKKGDVIRIKGRFKERFAEYVEDDKVKVQGLFGMKVKDLSKYNNKKYEVLKNNKPYKFTKFV